MGCVWVLRHGESTANVEGVIVSAPGPRAFVEVGLTPRGREQAREAARAAQEQGLGPGTVLIASDFARARETAEEFATGLGAEPPRIDQRLRERGFGALEEGPASAYDGVWARDRAREEPEGGVEPVGAVAARAREAILAADGVVRESGEGVVLVAHGDVLQIALALGAGMDPHDHRDVPHLGNAELRRLGGSR